MLIARRAIESELAALAAVNATAEELRLLASAIGLIRQDTQLSPVLEYIRKHVHSKLYIDHDNIRKAILARRSDQARQAMTAHLDSLMADVERFWETTLTSEADAE